MRAATVTMLCTIAGKFYFNPRSPCGLRQLFPVLNAKLNLISIHAAHAGCDQKTRLHYDCTVRISIHAAHAGCDKFFFPFSVNPLNFNPRSPCGLRPVLANIGEQPVRISIHAAHAGCDADRCMLEMQYHISIHAAHAGCDLNLLLFDTLMEISIHAAHAGCDQ